MGRPYWLPATALLLALTASRTPYRTAIHHDSFIRPPGRKFLKRLSFMLACPVSRVTRVSLVPGQFPALSPRALCVCFLAITEVAFLRWSDACLYRAGRHRSVRCASWILEMGDTHLSSEGSKLTLISLQYPILNTTSTILYSRAIARFSPWRPCRSTSCRFSRTRQSLSSTGTQSESSSASSNCLCQSPTCGS